MKFNKIKSLLTSGLSYILFGNFLSKFVALLSSVLVVRLVDKAEYAYLSYADNLYSYIGLFTGLGLASALLITCTPDVSLGKQRAYLNKALLYGGLFELLAALALCAVTQAVNIPFAEARKYIWLLLFYPMLTYLLNALQAFTRVKRNNRRYAVLGAVHTIAVCVVNVILVLLIGTTGVVFSRYLAVFLVIFLAAKYVASVNSGIRRETLSRTEVRSFLSTAIAMMLANLFSGIMPINEAFIVNNLIQDEVITANFKVAGIIPSMLPIITSSVMVYYFPIIAGMKHTPQVKRKVLQVAAINGIIIIGVTAIGMLLTPFGITLVYGHKYADSISLSYPLWIMRAVNAAFRMVPLNVLPAMGRSKFNAVVSVCTCIVHAILDYLFISWWNVRGIAYAAIIVYILSGCALWIYFIKTCPKKQEGASV